jgi:hypothetical protein
MIVNRNADLISTFSGAKHRERRILWEVHGEMYGVNHKESFAKNQIAPLPRGTTSMKKRGSLIEFAKTAKKRRSYERSNAVSISYGRNQKTA